METSIAKSHVHVISGLSTGGAEMMLQKLLLHSYMESTKPVVISLSDLGTIGEKLIKHGIEVHVFNLKNKKYFLLNLYRFISMVRKLNPAVIQGWMYHGNLFATLGSFFCFSGKELFWNIRHTPGDLKNEKKNTKTALHIGALLSFLPKGIIYNSYTSSDIHSLLGYRSDKAVIIGNGFDLSFFSPRMKKTDKDFSVALLGRFHPMKNHRMFFNVSKKLCSRYPKMKFLMAGRGVLSGNQWNDEWSGHGLLPEKLKVYDEIEVNSDLFSGIDLLVLCSSWGEAFPNIVGEAMACGVPCVVTDVGDSGRIVEDSGVIVPVNDEDALFAGIESFLASPALYESKSKKARKIIEDKFSLPTIVQKYRQLYKI